MSPSPLIDPNTGEAEAPEPPPPKKLNEGADGATGTQASNGPVFSTFARFKILVASKEGDDCAPEPRDHLETLSAKSPSASPQLIESGIPNNPATL